MRSLYTIVVASLIGVPAVQSQESLETPSSWDLQVGAAGLVIPAFPGADQHRVRFVPLVAIEYRNRVFVGQSRAGLDVAAGAKLHRSQRLTWTVEVGSYSPRAYRDADALAGMDRMNTRAYVGTGAAYTLGPLEATATLAADVKEQHDLLGTLGLATGLPLSRSWFLRAGMSAAFGDRNHAVSVYGVTEEEANRRSALLESGDGRLRPGDDQAFTPRAGLEALSADVAILHPMSDRVIMLVFGRMQQLQGDAAESPLVRRPTTYSSGVGVIYRFAGR